MRRPRPAAEHLARVLVLGVLLCGCASLPPPTPPTGSGPRRGAGAPADPTGNAVGGDTNRHALPAAPAGADGPAAPAAAPGRSGADERARDAASAPAPRAAAAAGSVAGAVAGPSAAPGGSGESPPARAVRRDDDPARASRGPDGEPAGRDEPADEERTVPPGEVVVWLEAVPKVVAPGDAVVVGVRISAPRPVGSVPFHLVFDPLRLGWERADEGGFLAPGAETAFLAALVAPGRLAVGASRLGPAQGVRGQGLVGTLTFRALRDGPVDLAFDRASVRDPAGRPLESRFVGTRIIVTAPAR